MTENIRQHIPDPTYHQEVTRKTHAYDLDRREELLDTHLSHKAHKDVFTLDDPELAHDVANAIKPEIDVVAALQKRIDNPHGRIFEVRGFPTSPENKRELEISQKAAKVDLEKNARQARDIALSGTAH